MIIDTEVLRKKLKQFEAIESDSIESIENDTLALSRHTSAEKRSQVRENRIWLVEQLWNRINNTKVENFREVTFTS